MNEPRTKADWIALAGATLPQLPGYASAMGTAWNHDQAVMYFQTDDWKNLWRVFNSLWERLPNSHKIRIEPFFDLCSLCSEYHLISESTNVS